MWILLLLGPSFCLCFVSGCLSALVTLNRVCNAQLCLNIAPLCVLLYLWKFLWFLIYSRTFILGKFFLYFGLLFVAPFEGWRWAGCYKVPLYLSVSVRNNDFIGKETAGNYPHPNSFMRLNLNGAYKLIFQSKFQRSSIFRLWHGYFYHF